jgi:flagellar biosynthesis/type III secretory pathway protein FliH
MDNIMVQGRYEQLLAHLIAYALQANLKVKPEAVIEALNTARNPYIRRTIISAAEQMIARGREKGLKEGLEQGLERGLEQGLERGLGQGLMQGRLIAVRATLVKFLTHKFGEAYVARVRARIELVQNPDVIDALIDEALVATDPAAFEARLPAAN